MWSDSSPLPPSPRPQGTQREWEKRRGTSRCCGILNKYQDRLDFFPIRHYVPRGEAMISHVLYLPLKGSQWATLGLHSFQKHMYNPGIQPALVKFVVNNIAATNPCPRRGRGQLALQYKYMYCTVHKCGPCMSIPCQRLVPLYMCIMPKCKCKYYDMNMVSWVPLLLVPKTIERYWWISSRFL